MFHRSGMRFVFSQLLGLLACTALTQAHGIVEELHGGGQVWDGNNAWSTSHSPGWAADNKDYGFVTDVSHPNISCHRDAISGTQYIPVQAGSEVRLKWSGSWPHPGPQMSYLARCQGGSCLDARSGDLEFFKIAESGLVKKFNNTYEGCYWGAFTIRDNNNTAVVRIPSNIKAGDYVLRHEIIALHAAYNVSGAQFYPQCVNLRISGAGNLQPTGTKGTQLYKQLAPGVKVNIYYPVPTDYAIPGPPVAEGLKFAPKSQRVKNAKARSRSHRRDVGAQKQQQEALEDDEALEDEKGSSGAT